MIRQYCSPRDDEYKRHVDDSEVSYRQIALESRILRSERIKGTSHVENESSSNSVDFNRVTAARKRCAVDIESALCALIAYPVRSGFQQLI